jgi:transcriptional regulator with XRE-family HTH domain
MNIAPGQFDPESALPLGERLRDLRQQHGLSLRELADQVGVTATALHSWENGRRNPKHKHLRAFAAAFQLSEADLLPASDAASEEGVSPARASRLAEVVAASKLSISAAAGVSADRVKIIIEV